MPPETVKMPSMWRRLVVAFLLGFTTGRLSTHFRPTNAADDSFSARMSARWAQIAADALKAAEEQRNDATEE